MGLAGALFAHKIAFLAPDIFTILLSIQFLLLVIVGGLGSLHGAILGAIFVALLPPLIAILRDSIPATMGELARSTGLAPLGMLGNAVGEFLKKPGVEAGIFGLILVLVILLEPLGMYGRWLKIKLFFSTFPMYKASPSSDRRATCGRSACDELLRADNLSINFGGIRAVDGVSFDVEQGEVFTIIGPNGAGKTTIFNLVSRIYEPTRWQPPSMDRHHQRAAAPDRRLGIARTFQNIELFEHATLLQNLLLARHVHRKSRSGRSFCSCRRCARWRSSIARRSKR